jgi:RNA recognition motif-containing protein
VSRGGNYNPAKREREAQKAQKKREKAERRSRRRERGAGDIPITTADEMTGTLPSIEDALRDLTDRAPRAAATIPGRLFVGGLSRDTTAEDLRQAFGEIGSVIDAVVVMDRATGSSRGFGFVTMQDRKDVPKAIKALDGADLQGRHIAVNPATERSR